jgi:glycosyltransferase involved in cell wall biosynthesis
MKILIAVPAHNEAAIITSNLKILSDFLSMAFKNFDWEIFVVENGSSDATMRMVREAADTNSKIKALSSQPTGKGRAIKTAWDLSDADILIFMDADLATDITALSKLLEQHKTGAGLVIGNRWNKNSVVERSLARTIYSKIYNLLAGAILDDHTPDHQCGFKSITKTAWQKISPHMKSDGWFFDSELLGLAGHFGFSIAEIPVNWSEKRTGKNKSRVKIFKTAKNLLINLFTLKKRLARLPKE